MEVHVLEGEVGLSYVSFFDNTYDHDLVGVGGLYWVVLVEL